MAIEIINYSPAQSSNEPTYGAYWFLQSFLMPAQAYNITDIKLYLRRLGTARDLNLRLYAADADDKPTGAIIYQQTYDTSAIPTSGENLTTFTLTTPPLLAANTKYCIVVNVPTGDGTHLEYFFYRITSQLYANGKKATSNNSGSTWNTTATQDFKFQVWGTIPISAPSATAQAATDITIAAAILHGTVANDGGEPCTVRFEYGLTDQYGTNTDNQAGKVTNDQFQATIENLDDDTTYHYRVKITNSHSSTYSADAQFTTEAIPIPPPTTRKVIIKHPAIESITVYREQQLVTQYQALSNLSEERIENAVELPVQSDSTVTVKTLPGFEYTYPIT
jgi:hypothetical protein